MGLPAESGVLVCFMIWMYHGIDAGMNQETSAGRKKVLYIVTKSNFGGAQRYVCDLAISLPKDQYEVVVAAGPGQGSALAGDLFSRLSQAGIRTVFIPQMQRDVSIADWGTFSSLYRLIGAERPDVVHLNSSKAGGLGALAARLRGVPRILFTVHGWAFREARNPLSRLLIYKVSALTVLLCHAVICISEFDRSAFAHFPLLKNKLRLVRTGIRGGETALSRESARKQLAGTSHAQDIWVGSIGELTFNKNIRGALDALVLARHTDTRLYYTVIGSGEQAEKLAAYATRRGLGDSVHFAGQIPDAARLLSAFDILLLPSRKEGLPYVLLEAALARVPIVATDVGGISELIQNGKSGALCNDGDTMGMADSLVELAADTTLRERFANALQEKVATEYSLERMARETAALYS